MLRPSSPLARSGFVLLTVLSGLIALASVRFLLGVAPPDVVAANRFFAGWFPLHALGATLALALGPLQFIPRIRNRHAGLHRWIGRGYVLACLGGGAAGLALALGASTGPISQTGFGLLAVLWLGSTLQGWRMARQGRFQTDHRAWMIRSFALTFAAVTLRLYLPLTQIAGLPFEDSYRAIAWACWVPNLLVAELILARSRPRRRSPATA